MYFKPEHIKQFEEEYSTIQEKYDELLIKYVSRKFTNQDAYEYAQHGFARRIKTLKRCIENIYTICPPDKSDKPTSDELTDLCINLQSFVFNIFGCIDNLAWIWVKEKNFRYEKNTEVTFSNKKIKEKLSSEFRNYLDSLESWFKNLQGFRHSLAHRIPLYVPPFVLNEKEAEKYTELDNKKNEALKQHNFELIDQISNEQDALGRFIPQMTHSFNEKSPRILFHAQVLADWNTVIEVAEKFLDELNYRGTK